MDFTGGGGIVGVAGIPALPINYDYSGQTLANLAAVNAQSQAALNPYTLYGSGGFGGTVGQYAAYPSFGEAFQTQSILDPAAGFGGAFSVPGSDFYSQIYGGRGGLNPFASSTYAPSFDFGGGGGFNPFSSQTYAPTTPDLGLGSSKNAGVGYTPQQFPAGSGTLFNDRFNVDSGFGFPAGFDNGQFVPPQNFDSRFGGGLTNYGAFGMYGNTPNVDALYGFGGAPGRPFDSRVFDPNIYAPGGGGRTGGMSDNLDQFYQSIYGGRNSGGWNNPFTVPDLQQMPQGQGMGSGK